MTKPLTTNRICEHLEKYIYDRIWDNPYQEYRTHVVPLLLNQVPTKGVFFGRYSRVRLPSENQKGYWLYSIGAGFFKGITLDVQDWVRLDEFCSTKLVDLRLFTTGGRTLWRKGIWIRQSPERDVILIAVDVGMFKVCSDATLGPDAVILEKYFDSDLVKDNVINCYTLTSRDVRFFDESNDPLHKHEGTYAYYDGRLVTSRAKNEDLTVGHYVEQVLDTDIIGTFDVDCTKHPQVYSSAEGGTRLLVHIPKSINNKNVILTANTFDMYLCPYADGYGAEEVRSIKLYMCGRQQWFHQLTHNDFSIDFEFLTNLAEASGMTKFYIRIFVRKHGQAKLPVREANYINLLYTNSDEDIVKFLLGKHEVNIPFWKADHLEDGLYADALIRRRNNPPEPAVQCNQCAFKPTCSEFPNRTSYCPGFSRRSLQDYIDILGYHHVAALIGKHVTHFEMTASVPNQAAFAVRAPIAIQDVGPLGYIPVVYHNGLKVEQDKIRVSYGTMDNHVAKEIQFTDESKFGQNVIADNYATKVIVYVQGDFHQGDKVCIDLIDAGEQGIRKYVYKKKEFTLITSSTQRFVRGTKYYFRIGQSESYRLVPGTDDYAGERIPANTYYILETNPDPLVIEMKHDDWAVYRMTYNEAHSGEGTYHDAYVTFGKWIDPGVFDPATKTLTVDTSGVDDEDLNLIVVDGSVGVHEEFEFSIPNSTEDVLCKDIWPVSKDDATKEITGEFPLVSEIVHLNNRYLIRGLDYSATGMRATQDVNARLFLQNVSYLQAGTNKVDVFRTMMSDLNVFRGYLGGKVIYWTNQEPFWFDELSTLSIDGEVCSDIVHAFGKLTVTGQHRNGSPFEVRTSIPSRIREVLTEYHREEDVNKMLLLKEYFSRIDSRRPYITIVPHSHKVYSIYLARLVSDYLKGEFVIGTWEQIVDQLPKYAWWKEHDVVYAFDSMDKKFVDIYPTFNRLPATREQYVKITELVKKLIPTDPIKHKDDANVY